MCLQQSSSEVRVWRSGPQLARTQKTKRMMLNMCLKSLNQNIWPKRKRERQNNGCRSFCFRAVGEQCEHYELPASTFERIMNYLHLDVLFNQTLF